jgi:multidrug efflux system membrane fusion protein
LRAQFDLSDAVVSERTLKAPFDGWVRDVRVHESQHLAAGDVVVSLMKDGAETWARVLVPGQHRPM